MSGASSRLAFKVLAAVIAIPVGRAASKLTATTWTKVRPEDPQHDPKRPESGWRDTLIFAAITGLGATIAQLATSKGADTAWRALTGDAAPAQKSKEKAKSKKAKSNKAKSNTMADVTTETSAEAGVTAG